MKRRTKKQTNKQEVTGFSSIPPWTKFKSKQSSYQGGFNAGYEQAVSDKHERLNEREKDVQRRELDVRVKVLSNICQAGSEVVMSMSKALLAFERCL